jgi:hypothetical protein
MGFSIFSILLTSILALKRRLSLSSLLLILGIAVVVIALFQPWWGLSGSHSKAERATSLFLIPQVMIESTTYRGKVILDIAEMPQIFVNTLGKIVAIAYAACTVLGLGCIMDKMGKKPYSLFLRLLGLVLLIILLSLFYYSTAKLCEVSIGNLQGEGYLKVSLGHETIEMFSRWGLSIGFYLIIASIIIISFSLLFTKFRFRR